VKPSRGAAATAELQQILIQKQDPPIPVIRTSVTESTQGKGGVSSIVTIQFYNGTTGGSYTLSYSGRTKVVNWSTSDPTNIGRKLKEGLIYVTQQEKVTVKFDQTSTITQPRFKVQIPGFTGTVLGDSIVPYVFGATGGTNEIQKVTVDYGTATGSFRLGLPINGATLWTGNLSLAASESAIQTALNNVLPPGSVSVTRTDNNGQFLLFMTFTGSLAAQNLQPLQVQVAPDTPTASGTFTLSYGGQTTPAITLSNSTTTLANAIQTALRGLSNIGTGNVQVSYDTTSTANAPRFHVTFTGSLAGSDTDQITASGTRTRIRISADTHSHARHTSHQ
jgi:hypothetical protein